MKYEVWQSSDDQKWYWHLRTSSNKIVSDGVGYLSQDDVIECINKQKGTKYVGIQIVTEHESLYGLIDIFSDTEGLLR
jgi:hypothetical protein